MSTRLGEVLSVRLRTPQVKSRHPASPSLNSWGEAPTLPPCATASARSKNGPISHAIFTAGRASISSSIRTSRRPKPSRSLIAGDGVVLARFGIHMTGRGGKARPPLLNARTDGMRKGQFRTHLEKQRCVIPAEGFYEWREEGRQAAILFQPQGRQAADAGGHLAGVPSTRETSVSPSPS